MIWENYDDHENGYGMKRKRKKNDCARKTRIEDNNTQNSIL